MPLVDANGIAAPAIQKNPRHFDSTLLNFDHH